MSLRQLDSRYRAVADEIRIIREEGRGLIEPAALTALLDEQQTLRQRRDKANGIANSILHATCS